MSCYVVSCYVSSRGGGNTTDNSVVTERAQEQKEKMQVELQALWSEQNDQLRKKKEQCATEVGKRPVLKFGFQFKMLRGQKHDS